jgi:hypothetical protein
VVVSKWGKEPAISIPGKSNVSGASLRAGQILHVKSVPFTIHYPLAKVELLSGKPFFPNEFLSRRDNATHLSTRISNAPRSVFNRTL